MPSIELIDNNKRNKIQKQDFGIHHWYQFILGYPPHLVRYYIEKFDINTRDIIFDPFCGTGTTPVEAIANGISCYGLEANPIAYFADLKYRPIAVKPIGENMVCIIEFDDKDDYEKIWIKNIKLYKLVREKQA